MLMMAEDDRQKPLNNLSEDANDEDIGIELVVEADKDEKVVELTSDDDGPRKVVEDADWVDCIV